MAGQTKAGDERRHWIAVASANHVQIGRSQGFMQVNHGKAAPLRRIRPGDLIAYYSPSTALGSKEPYRHFTAIGQVGEREPYQAEMAGGFKPFRRDVTWFDGHDAPIAPLLEQLDFSKGKANWGYQLRFGLFEISAHDMALIGRAMGVVSAHFSKASDQA